LTLTDNIPRSLILGIAFVLSLTGAANAADDLIEPPAFQSRWSGFYAGAITVYGHGESQQFNTLGPTTGEYDIDGWMGGGLIGHNWQFGQAVVGLEADWMGGETRGTTYNTCVSNCYTDAEWIATVRARVGLDLGMVLPYITGGVAFTKLDAGTVNPLVVGQPLGNDDINAGMAFGAGVDVAFGNNLVGRLEYLHVDMGDTVYHIRAQSAAGTVDGEVDLFRAGLIWQIGNYGATSESGYETASVGGWAGGYGGLLFGSGHATSRQDNSFPATTGDYGIAGNTYGVFAGYNWQFGQAVLGAEADVSNSTIEGWTNNGCGA